MQRRVTYYFKDANKELNTSPLFLQRLIKMQRPLIVTLHGLGAGPSIMMNKQAVDLAEEGGYILVAPMGYNERGWYGVPFSIPAGKTPPKPAPANEGAAAKPAPKASLFFDPNDPPNCMR